MPFELPDNVVPRAGLVIASAQNEEAALAARVLRERGLDVELVHEPGPLLDELGLVGGKDMLLVAETFGEAGGLAFCRKFSVRAKEEAPALCLWLGTASLTSISEVLAAGAADWYRGGAADAAFAHRILRGIEIERMRRELGQRRVRRRGEIDLAAMVQRALLAGSLDGNEGLSSELRHRPAAAFAGDLCGQVAIDGQHTAFFLLDVSGQGTRAAMVAVAAAGALGRLLAGGRFVPRRLEDELAALLSVEQTGHHGTLALAILNHRSGALRVYNYGHPPVLLATAGGRLVQFEASAPPLGAGYAGFSPVEVGHGRMGPGDRLLLFSNGLIGATAAFQRRLDAIKAVLRERAQLATAADALLALAEAPESPDANDDDAVLLLVELHAQGGTTTGEWQTDERHVYQIPSLLSQMPPWWQGVEALLVDRGWGPVGSELLMSVNLACIEAVTNAIKHGHAEDGRPLRLELHLGADAFEIHICDSGPGFRWDPNDAIDIPDPLAETGRGLFLIKSLVTEVRYTRRAGENTLVLRQERMTSECQEPTTSGCQEPTTSG